VGAVRVITVERGHDPADFALLSFGGGGGLVAVDVARELSIPRVIMPPGPGTFSAFGMLMANVQYDFSRTKIALLNEADLGAIAADFEEMRLQGARALDAEGFTPQDQEFASYVDLRYLGQEHSVMLTASGEVDAAEIARLQEAFAVAHERSYGHTMPDPIEMVALRLTALGRVEAPSLPKLTPRVGRQAQPRGKRMVYQDSGERIPYSVYDRDDFAVGDLIAGPAIISEHTATTVFHTGDTAGIGAYGEIVISVAKTK
jgi:N-methylhydantoinase A